MPLPVDSAKPPPMAFLPAGQTAFWGWPEPLFGMVCDADTTSA